MAPAPSLMKFPVEMNRTLKIASAAQNKMKAAEAIVLLALF